MEFLKACTTNIRSIDNVLQTRFAVYNINSGSERIYEALVELKENGILCTFAQQKQKLWVFAVQDDRVAGILIASGVSSLLESDGNLGQGGPNHDANMETVKWAFLNALEESLSFALGRDGIFRIGHWTWLFTASGDNGSEFEHSILLRLHPEFTSNGTLRISTATQKSSLCSLNQRRELVPVQVFTAPGGKHAQLAVGADGSSADSSFDSAEWRLRVIQLAHLFGISIDTDEAWVSIKLCEGNGTESVAWPARLCYHNTYFGNLDSGENLNEDSWKQWFDIAGKSPVQNPFNFAANWFTDSSFRDKDSLSRQQTSNDAVTNDTNAALYGMEVDGPLTTASPFNQRIVDQQLALAGIYPTPPDGLIQASANQQTTSDGMNAAVQMEPSTVESDLAPVSEDSHLQGQSTRSSIDATGYQLSADDLFGDLDEMDFAENEVGDDDFAYFDEPDEIPNQTQELDTVTADGMENQAIGMPEEELSGIGKSLQDLGPENAVLNADKIVPPAAESPPNMDIQDSATGVLTRPWSKTSDEVHFGDSSESVAPEPEKPLSPFGIRERLLPPPIPASIAQTDTSQLQRLRRGSQYSPMAFNEGLDLSAKYSTARQTRLAPKASTVTLQPSMVKSHTLPDPAQDRSDPYSTQNRPQPTLPTSEDQYDGISSESEEDSDNSDTRVSRSWAPSRMPWETKKRKRTISESRFSEPDLQITETEFVSTTTESLSGMLEKFASRNVGDTVAASKQPYQPTGRVGRRADSVLESLPQIDDFLDLKPDDLVYIGQIIGEQAVCTPVARNRGFCNPATSAASAATETAIRSLIDATCDRIIPNQSLCDLSSLALIRDPPRAAATHLKTPAGHPRQHQRTDGINFGPDIFQLPPPYVRVQRGNDTWEMLPTALTFWSALSLGPANGAKNVQVIGIAPSGQHCLQQVEAFLNELGRVYERRKLGNWIDFSKNDEVNALENFENGLIGVQLEEKPSLLDIFKAYANTCSSVGTALAHSSHRDSDRTIVVLLVNPFQHDKALQYLCACFWILCKAYRDNVPRSSRRDPQSDLILKLLPIDLVAAPDCLLIPDAEQLGALVTDIHDRCPPSASSKAANQASALPILAVPSVEIAVLPPKRIGFQLNAETPSDLLHEGSVLHLAYALADDRRWMTTYWIDSTGRYQDMWSSYLGGRSFADRAQEVWERTLEIIAAREVTWRVFITAVNGVQSLSERDCWRTIATAKPRKQALHVTLVSIQRDPELQLISQTPLDSSIAGGASQATGIATPATTPQGATYTVSPDSSSSLANAPPTPAPSETVATIAENDPDAHLIDLTDESWGMLLSHVFAEPAQKQVPAIAEGMLFRRGDLQAPHSSGCLEALGVSLHWDIRLRPSAVVDEGPLKQAEVTLRETLRMYRTLGVLTNAKGLTDVSADGGYEGRTCVLPLHVIAALRGARGLNGFLS